MLDSIQQKEKEIDGIAFLLPKIQPGARSGRFLHVGSRQGGFALGGLTENEDDSLVLVPFETLDKASPVERSGEMGWGDLGNVNGLLHGRCLLAECATAAANNSDWRSLFTVMPTASRASSK